MDTCGPLECMICGRPFPREKLHGFRTHQGMCVARHRDALARGAAHEAAAVVAQVVAAPTQVTTTAAPANIKPAAPAVAKAKAATAVKPQVKAAAAPAPAPAAAQSNPGGSRKASAAAAPRAPAVARPPAPADEEDEDESSIEEYDEAADYAEYMREDRECDRFFDRMAKELGYTRRIDPRDDWGSSEDEEEDYEDGPPCVQHRMWGFISCADDSEADDDAAPAARASAAVTTHSTTKASSDRVGKTTAPAAAGAKRAREGAPATTAVKAPRQKASVV